MQFVCWCVRAEVSEPLSYREREYGSSKTFPWVGRAPRLLTSRDLASPFPRAPPLSRALSTLFWSGKKSFLVSNFLSPVAVGKITRSAPSIGRQVAKLKAHTAKQIKQPTAYILAKPLHQIYTFKKRREEDMRNSRQYQQIRALHFRPRLKRTVHSLILEGNKTNSIV